MITVHPSSDEPCPLERYTRVLAELADHGCDLANPRATGFNEVLAEHGFSRAAWRAAEGYWSAKLADTSPQFSPGQATRFRVLMANEQRRRAI